MLKVLIWPLGVTFKVEVVGSRCPVLPAKVLYGLPLVRPLLGIGLVTALPDNEERTATALRYAYFTLQLLQINYLALAFRFGAYIL
ncbi:hypothetical protein Dimus_036332 [Dionaea muscipula]